MIEHLIDQLAEQIEAICESPELIRDTANYQFTLQMRDRLVTGGFGTPLDAEQVVSEMKVELTTDFHTEYPEQFDRLLTMFSSAILNMKIVIDEDFEDGMGAIKTFAKQMSVSFG